MARRTRASETRMGIIEETRQLLQDFVAPEMRSLDARMSALEEKIESLKTNVEQQIGALDAKLDRQIGALDAKLDRQVDALNAKLDRQVDAINAKADKNHTEVMDAIRRMEAYHLLAERLARLESKVQSAA